MVVRGLLQLFFLEHIRFLVILIFLGVSYLTIRAVSEDLHECIFALSRQNYDQVNAGYT